MRLAHEHGPILGSPTLWRLLGYRSAEAFRKAVQRDSVPVRTFELPTRRGRFARTEEVIAWLETVTAEPVPMAGTPTKEDQTR